MNADPKPQKFTMKITAQVKALATLALAAEAPEEKRLRDLVSYAMNRLQITGGEAAALASVLFDYAEGNLREGSEEHRLATGFAHALGDVAVTADETLATAVRELQEAVTEESAVVDAAAARADAVFRERMNERRDEGLREVFTGGPLYRFNIWTDRHEPVETFDEQSERFRREAKTTPFHPTPLQRVRHLDGVVGAATPLTRQQAADAADALGPIVDHNQQMKVEGAEQLIVDRNRAVGDRNVKPGDILR